MNGYFQLLITEVGASVIIYPPTEGGTVLDANEVVAYLGRMNITTDIKIIHAAISGEKEITVPVTKNKTYPTNEKMFLEVSEDNMSVKARFYPPSKGTGKFMDKAEIVGDLKYHNITFGIIEETIDDFLANKEYCKDYIIALGKPMEVGKDAYIEYFFNTDTRVRPTVKEDGSVDFFHLNILNNVSEGELLARLHPEVPGVNGSNVFSDPIMPPPVQKGVIKFGRKIRLSDDKTEIFSEVNGHVSLVDGRVFVSDVYEVENVDTATGDIDYDGSVKVNGNVCTNFSVKAKGDIEVTGIVEGAYLEAGGNIIIGRGMNGMEKGEIVAGGNIISKFLENAKATAKGYVESETIIHSTVVAGTEVHVHGKRGFITGGKVSACSLVQAKVFGSDMGATTTIEVGPNPELKVRAQNLRQELSDIQKSIKKVDPVVLAAAMKLKSGVTFEPDQMVHMKKLADESRNLHNTMNEDLFELNEIESILDIESEAAIEVTDVMYPGTILVISEATMTVKKPYKYCRFKKVRGDVKMEGM